MIDDEQDNSKETPEDDWEMSQPDSDVKKEFVQEEEEKAEDVPQIYDPLKTSELDDWDIPHEESFEQETQPPVAQSPPPVAQSPPVFDPAQATFRVPQYTTEIIEPEKPHVKAENWEMPPPPNQDGFVMPEAHFQRSSGTPLKKVADFSVSNAASPEIYQPVDEELSDIYAPPDTEESSLDTSEDFDSSEDEFEVSESEDEASEFSDESQSFLDPQEQTIEAEPKKSKGKVWALIVFGILIIGILLAAILTAGYYFYYLQNSM